MRTIFCVVLCLLSGHSLAGGDIVPTDDPGSDCVAATIATPRGAANRKYDEAYCAVNKDPAAYRTCLKNAAANPTISFFTDRCGEAGDGAYVSFNGQTHQVWRKSESPHRQVRYAGTYTGKGVSVRVVPGKLIERFVEDGEVMGITHSVDVFITQGGETVKIPAVYDDRH
ncbi:hypothetical protein [Lysobacter capsici]|uniref:hypothetical protein n=1 Tax=Lysobacter capsici TaxID=435897 RepID=UPI001C000555|nr:hypothetical protein [Lysobacter capsici]QWF17141.1 hypothetical protein KME82_26025 [Lysobacter capsici]